MGKDKTIPYDAAEFLRDEADCAAYLQAVMEEDAVTEQNIAAALGDIARARGMAQLARATAWSSTPLSPRENAPNNSRPRTP
jgi:probable addiction module antidote protein